MVEVGMGVENVADGESELVHLVQDPLVRSTGIDDDGLLRHWIANDRTIATKGRDGKGFSNHDGHDERMLPSKPIRAQAAAGQAWSKGAGMVIQRNVLMNNAGCEGQFMESVVDKSGAKRG